MDSLTSGTFVGAGSFRCARCGYTLTLAGSDMLTDCPGCGGREFVRASLFSTERITAGTGGTAVTQTQRGHAATAARSRPRRTAGQGQGADRAAGRVPLLRGERRAAHGRAHARVDACGTQPRRRRALRRPDGLPPPRADRAPSRRRAPARRPQPQRRVRQRRARRRQGAAGRRRDHRGALPPRVPERAGGRRCAARRAPRQASLHTIG